MLENYLTWTQTVIRFHLDENVDHAVAHGLKIRGVDVTTTADANLLGADDLKHVAFALQHKRVIFTQDQDFLRIHATNNPHAGIVYSKNGSRSTGAIIRFLKLMSECLTPDEMYSQIEFF